MKTLLIVFHTMTGGSQQMALAAAEGAKTEIDVEVRMLLAQQAGPEDLLRADGYLFVTPENLESMSGMMRTSSTAAITRCSSERAGAPMGR